MKEVIFPSYSSVEVGSILKCMREEITSFNKSLQKSIWFFINSLIKARLLQTKRMKQWSEKQSHQNPIVLL